MRRSTTLPKLPALLPALVSVCLLTVSSTVAAVSQRMGNITFECPDGWRLDGPDCYLMVDVAMTLMEARDLCETYGSEVVEIRDELEATSVATMVKGHSTQWDNHWINNNLTDSESVCGGFWGTGEPKNADSTPILVSACARGTWYQTDVGTRLPFICRAEACVEGTFRCRDQFMCISNNYKCDGVYDCEDESDENNCPNRYSETLRGSTGTLTKTYSKGQTYSWFIEGPKPGKPLSIKFTSLNLEADVDCVEVWSGGPSFKTSRLQERICGQLTSSREIYGGNNFLIIRLTADLSEQRTGFQATWKEDAELCQDERRIEATDAWTDLTSPYFGSDPLPRSYVRHYTVFSADDSEGSLITMEVLKNELDSGFEFDPETLIPVGATDSFPDTYISGSNSFTFYLNSHRSDEPRQFQARVKKGCMVEFTRANGYLTSPNMPPSPYPASSRCTYLIRAPQGAQRAFKLRFFNNLADSKDTVTVHDGNSNSASNISVPTNNDPFYSTGPEVFVEFSSSLVQSNGFFKLSYDMACPALADTNNMLPDSNSTHFESEVTVRCQTGYAFAQEDYLGVTAVTIRCGFGGKWNVSRLPTCRVINCGIPEVMSNGYVLEGSGGARYGHNVTYACFPGFNMNGSPVSTCGADSDWSVRPTCTVAECPIIAAIPNGNYAKVLGNGRSAGSIYNYTCDPGYDLIGARFRLCTPASAWSPSSTPSCTKIKCPIPEIDRATLTPPANAVEFESNLKVVCNNGYVINGTTTSTKDFPCLASGTFGIARDVCVDKDECAGPSPCLLDHQQCVNTMGGQTCVCKAGYIEINSRCEVEFGCKLNTSGCDDTHGSCTGDDTCVCATGYLLFTENGISGRYIPGSENGLKRADVYYLNHTCVPVTCDSPPAIEHGKPLKNKTLSDFKTEVHYRCDFGYRIASNSYISCNSSGLWTEPTPVCQALTCDPLAASGNLVSAIYPNASTNEGDQVSLECISQSTNTKYNKTLFCVFDRESQSFKLQGDSPDCPAIDCGTPEPVGGASFTVTSSGLGASFTFGCLVGFAQEGMSASANLTVTCGRNGRWGFGNLTCTGVRCLDPGTPGGMQQISANFEVNGTVVYKCYEGGFEPNPLNRTCSYNANTGQADWDSSVPACIDVEKPTFSNCPTEPIQLKLYQTVMMKHAQEPSAQDNSKLTFVTVDPLWFQMDLPLADSVNVTYTANDFRGNEEICSFSVVVNDPSILPSLVCPTFLIYLVNSADPYNVSIADNVTADTSDLHYDAGPQFTVKPDTVGKTTVRVTATNQFGLQRQCAFVVDIRPNVCLATYFSPANAEHTCTGPATNLSCTAACNSGYAYHDGTTSKTYTCEGTNQWSPSLPAQDCIKTVDAEYTYLIRGVYSLSEGVLDCQNGLQNVLATRISSREWCRYFYNEQYNDLPLAAEFQFINLQTQSMTAEISLRVADTVDKSVIKVSHYQACGSSLSDNNVRSSMLLASNVSCTNKTALQQLPTQSTEYVRSGWACANGRVVKTIGGKQKCVTCAPGSFQNNSECDVCPDGKYQDSAGQTECKVCEKGTQHSVLPRSSFSHCIASCPLGFTNGKNYTDNPDLECTACPVDTYIDTLYTSACKACSGSMTTSGFEGASACIDKCAVGMFPLNNTACAPCPDGFYKSDIGNVACSRCPTGQSTAGAVGSTNSSACVNFAIPACENPSPNLGIPLPYCVCDKGYSGQFCNVSTDSCLSSPCYNGGTCTSTGSFTFQCACPANFNGSRCEVDTYNDCTPNTCVNSSFCRDLIGTADCVCPSSSLHVYTQPKCIIDSNVCTPSQCVNQATCLPESDGEQAFTCVCRPGFTGKLCETDIDDCKNNPNGCVYGGSCKDVANGYTCDCGDYKGAHCQTLPDFCAMNLTFCQNGMCFNDYNSSFADCSCEFPYRRGSDRQCHAINQCLEDNRCVNNSTCNDVAPGKTACSCQPGYTGSLCQHNIDDCASTPCHNGRCEDLVDAFVCHCNAGYNDTLCDNNIDDCASSGCVQYNTANCEDEVDNYKCVCNVGWTGTNCEVNIDECLSLPCQHGGTCTQSATPGQYNCTCRDGWMGDNCKELADFCPDDTCASSATCYSLQDDYFCECKGGSTGKNCSQFENLCDKLEPCEAPSSCQRDDIPATCNCSMGYTGSSCNLIKDSCKDNPCQNGVCVPQVVGYTCKCAEGYSGVTDCAEAADPCDAISCPSECVVFMGKPVCLCGANQVKSGANCKDVSSDFDIYFKKPAESVPSIQPFNWTNPTLSVTFWVAPTADTNGSIVELRRGNSELVLAVKIDMVMTFNETLSFGDSRNFDQGRWNHFSMSCSKTLCKMYVNGIEVDGGILSDNLPSPPVLMAAYLGEDFQGYISQVQVFQRVLNFTEVLGVYEGTPSSPVSDDLLLTWSGYELTSNVWSRLIHPSMPKRPERPTVCEDGKSGTACDGEKPDKDPPSVPGCPDDRKVTKKRLAQVNDFFSEQNLTSNINGTVIPVGAHRLVFMAQDAQNNVAFCRFNVYVKRSGQMLGSSQHCGVTNGLSNVGSCSGRGQQVQCPNDRVAPLSPKILTCGKLGVYNWAMPSLLPPAVVCGDTQPLRYRMQVKLRYLLGKSCRSDERTEVAQKMMDKVVALNNNWPTLCNDSSCSSANTSDVTCEDFYVNASVIIKAVPATLSDVANTSVLTAKELLQKSVLEDSAFAITELFNAQLQRNDVEIIAVPGCIDGYGLHREVCVKCTQGSYLNAAKGKCQLCPVGSFSNVDMATGCTECPTGQTTLQRGATACVDKCGVGSAYNISAQLCSPCQKDFYTDEEGQVYCKFCPAGTDNEGPGSNSSSGCVDTCPAGSELNNQKCELCPRGKYSDGIDIDRCKDCPAGTTTAKEGTTSENSCGQTACNPGSFRNISNQCESCDYGTFQPEKWKDKCLSCNDSYTTNSTASTSPDQCLYYCKAGFQLVSAANKTCEKCPRGHYKSNEGLDKIGTCKPCPDSNTTNDEGAVSILECSIKPCSAGQKISANGDCEDCPVDTYQEDPLPSRNTYCRGCGTGKGTKGDKQTSSSQCEPVCGAGEEYDESKKSCEPCPMGTYNTGNSTQRFESCAACRDGYVTVNETKGASSSQDCSLRNCTAGEFIGANDACIKCPLGQYQDKPRKTKCIACRTNTNTSEEGSTSSSQCTISCSLGEEQKPNTENDCQACKFDFIKNPAGPGVCTQCTGNNTSNAARSTCDVLYCDRGFQLSSGSCVACEVGKFKADRGNETQCQDCPANTTTSASASTSQNDCNIAKCVPGFYSTNGLLPCLPCPVGTFKSSTGNEACTNCSGAFTTASEASVAQSQCNVAVCPLGRYRDQNGDCLECAKGFFANETGLTACFQCGQGLTTVDAESNSADLCVPICARGQYLNVTAKDCTNCSLGTFNPEEGTGTSVVLQCQTCPTGNTTSTTGAVSAADCNIVDCGPGSFRSTNGGCEQCPVGSYQPVKSQPECKSCMSGYTTHLPGRQLNTSCVKECSDGYEYVSINQTCEVCPIGYFRDKTQNIFCVMCPQGYTTLTTGQKDCKQMPPGPTTTPAPITKVTVKLFVILIIQDCGTSDPLNKRLLVDIIFQNTLILFRTFSIAQYPGVCQGNCDNVDVLFGQGCLKGLKVRRTKRDSHTEQVMEVIVTDVDNTLEHKNTSMRSSAKRVVEGAFYDSEDLSNKLKEYNVELKGVIASEEVISCPSGSYPNGSECKLCDPGSYSALGARCTPCAENTYQDQAGFNSCISCPSKKFTTTTGASQLSQCVAKCSQANAGQNHCSGHGQCIFDQSTPDGVRCECEDNYSGNDCSMREASEDKQTYMIAGIVGGSCAFLLLLLIIFGIVAWLRRGTGKGGSRNSSKDGKKLTREEDGTTSEGFMNYNFPMYNNPVYDNNSGLVARHGGTPIMYVDPNMGAVDDDVRDFYASDRSRPSGSRARSYAEEWKTLPEVARDRL